MAAQRLDKIIASTGRWSRPGQLKKKQTRSRL